MEASGAITPARTAPRRSRSIGLSFSACPG
jgi:hypothetical protein